MLCQILFCIKCHTPFSGENKKNIINLSSAELAHRVVHVNTYHAMSKDSGDGSCMLYVLTLKKFNHT